MTKLTANLVPKYGKAVLACLILFSVVFVQSDVNFTALDYKLKTSKQSPQYVSLLVTKAKASAAVAKLAIATLMQEQEAKIELPQQIIQLPLRNNEPRENLGRITYSIQRAAP